MWSVTRWLAPCSLVVALAACESADAVGPEPVTFQASVAEAGATGTYEGRGFFRLFDPPAGVMRPASFSLFSADPDRATREVQTFLLGRLGPGLPAPGTYSLAPGSGDRFHASYGRLRRGSHEHFAALSGEVTITTATAERVEGSFHFRAVRVCSGSGPGTVCVVRSDRLPTDGPTVEVSGTFSARPAPAAMATPLRP